MISINGRFARAPLYTSEAETKAEALLEAIGRGLDLTGIILHDAVLHGISLRNVHLRSADLSRADLRGADLRGASLGLADLREADLRGADLTGADLSLTKCDEADFTGANLRRVTGVTVPTFTPLNLSAARGLLDVPTSRHRLVANGDGLVYVGCLRGRPVSDCLKHLDTMARTWKYTPAEVEEYKAALLRVGERLGPVALAANCAEKPYGKAARSTRVQPNWLDGS